MRRLISLVRGLRLVVALFVIAPQRGEAKCAPWEWTLTLETITVDGVDSTADAADLGWTTSGTMDSSAVQAGRILFLDGPQ
jgi:hypothetical protein